MQRRRSHTEHGILLLPFEGFRCFSLLPLLLLLLPSPSWGKTCKMHAPHSVSPSVRRADCGPPAARPEEESQYREHVSGDKPQRGQVGLEGGCVTRSVPSPPGLVCGTTPDKKSASDGRTDGRFGSSRSKSNLRFILTFIPSPSPPPPPSSSERSLSSSSSDEDEIMTLFSESVVQIIPYFASRHARNYCGS